MSAGSQTPAVDLKTPEHHVTSDLCVCSRKMIADIFGESGDEEEEEFTVSTTVSEFAPQLHLLTPSPPPAGLQPGGPGGQEGVQEGDAGADGGVRLR